MNQIVTQAETPGAVSDDDVEASEVRPLSCRPAVPPSNTPTTMRSISPSSVSGAYGLRTVWIPPQVEAATGVDDRRQMRVLSDHD